jgi:tetratricopeptide (TPR) repeat protein
VRAGILLLLCAACASDAEYVRNGDALFAQKGYEAAQAEYFKALELNPDSAAAHLGLGIVYLYTGRFEEAEQAIARARRIEDTERAIVTLSILRHQQKRYVEAASLLREALARAPDSAMLHFRLGLVQLDAGDLESAADALTTAVTLDPQMLDAHVQLATALKRLRRYQEALDVLTDARRSFRGREVGELHSSLGEVYEAMNMPDYAKHAYEQALKRDPSSVGAMCGLARTLRAVGGYTEAIEMLQKGLRDQPNAVPLHLELGLTFEEYQLKPQAVQSLLKVTELSPFLPDPYPRLLVLLDDPAKLYEVLAKAARALPDDATVQLRYGRAAFDKGDMPAAAAALGRAIAVEPSSVEGNYYLGLAQLRSGNKDGAQETYEALKYLDAAKADELLDAIDKPPPGEVAAPAAAKAKRKSGRAKRRRR